MPARRVRVADLAVHGDAELLQLLDGAFEALFGERHAEVVARGGARMGGRSFDEVLGRSGWRDKVELVGLRADPLHPSIVRSGAGVGGRI